MSSLSNFLIEGFRNYNICFLSILIILQCIGIPTGATLLVIASGAFAYAGELNIVILLLEIWFFSCIGDSIAYFMWKFIGKKTLNRSSKVKAYIGPKILLAKSYLHNHGIGAVFFTRFLISAMGPFINAAAGITSYNLTTFCSFVALGELMWTCMYLGLGYWFGDSWEDIVPIVTQSGQILTYTVVLVVIIYFFIKIIRKDKVKGKK